MSTKEKKETSSIVQGHTEHLYNLYKHNGSKTAPFLHREHLFTPETERRYADSIHRTHDLLHSKMKLNSDKLTTVIICLLFQAK